MYTLLSIVCLLSIVSRVPCLAAQASGQTVILEDPKITSPRYSNLVKECPEYAFPHVICIHRHGSVIRGDFSRNPLNGVDDTYASTSTPDDPSFSLVKKATFLVFDPISAPHILGPNPTLEFMFQLPDATHEGPVYSPDTNELYFQRVQTHLLSQLVVNLSATSPSLQERVADPPIYAATGGKYHNGEIIYVAMGGEAMLEGHSFRPGIYALDVFTGKSRTLLNNYYGYYFSSLDDMDIDDRGQIWVTNNDYSRADFVNPSPAQMPTGVFRFDLHTGHASLVETTLDQPNGIAFSPNHTTLYISDTGAGAVTRSPFESPSHFHFNATKPRFIYAFDVDARGTYLTNKRPVFQSMEWATDGIKTSREGYLVAATGKGIDVLTKEGMPVVRIQTNFTVANLAFVPGNGPEGGKLWAVGRGGVARVRWALKGW